MADNQIWMLGHFAHVTMMFRASAAVDAAWVLLAASHSTDEPQSFGLAASCDLDLDVELAMLILDENPRLDTVTDHVSSLWEQWNDDAKRNQQESQCVLALVEAYAVARLRQQSPLQSIDGFVQPFFQRMRNDRSKCRQQQESSNTELLGVTKTNEGLKRRLEDAERGARRKRRELEQNYTLATESNERLMLEVDLMKQNLDETRREVQSLRSALSCPICNERDRDTPLNCGHLFCGCCLSRWEPRPEVRGNGVTILHPLTCPVCRKRHSPLSPKLKIFRS